jgi:hypothetical protein
VSSHYRDSEWRRKQIAECRALMAEVNTDPAYRQCREYILKSLPRA